jgi:predicted RND superfamily exporter protein
MLKINLFVYYLTGSSISELKELAMKEKTWMVWSAIGLLFLVLFFGLPSYVMPILFMATLGLSVVYNLGLNFFIGRKVSYITSAVAAALQLGVTMDFCIFLVHSFQEESKSSNPETAMIHSITKTARAIISSALTTAVGFATLSVMRIKLGADLGLTLAFGVVISVVVALTVLPALILKFKDKLDRYQHRSIIPSFEGISPWIVKNRQGLFIVFAFGLVLSYAGYSKVDLSFDISDSFPDSLHSITALKELKPKLGTIDTVYLVSRDVPVWKLQQITEKLEKHPAVSKVSSLDQVLDPAIPEEFAPSVLRDRFTRGGWRNTMLSVTGGGLEPEMVSLVNEGKKLAKEAPGTIYFTGQPVITNDSKAISTKDSNLVDSLSLAAIFLIVALAFASFGVPVVIVAIIQLAIWFNQALVYCSGNPMFFFARMAIGAIQLGATVDYAILMTNTFKEEREAGYGSLEAMQNTINKSCPAILNSGLALFAATCGVYLTSSLKIVKDLAMLLARGALISMTVVCFLLPAVLLAAEGFLKKTSRTWPNPVKE